MPKDKFKKRAYKSVATEQFHPYRLLKVFECIFQNISKEITDKSRYLRVYILNSFGIRSKVKINN